MKSYGLQLRRPLIVAAALLLRITGTAAALAALRDVWVVRLLTVGHCDGCDVWRWGRNNWMAINAVARWLGTRTTGV